MQSGEGRMDGARIELLSWSKSSGRSEDGWMKRWMEG